MWNALVLASLIGFTGSAQAQESATWDALAEEYEVAFTAWAHEMSRSGGWAKPEAERPPAPAVEYRPRFDALAKAGEGRAVLWLLGNQHGSGDERAARLRANFERVRAAGDAEWVGEALLALGKDRGGLDAALLGNYFETMAEPEHPAPLRLSALLARADLVQDSDAQQAADLRLCAALLRYRGVDVDPGEEVPAEDLQELAAEAVVALKKDESTWFTEAFRKGDDGSYSSRAVFPANPKETWRPVIEVLAERGAAKARVWVLFNTGPKDDAEKERLRAHLDALTREALEPETLRELGWRVSSLTQSLGGAFVEERLRRVAEQAPEELRAGLWMGLGDGLCEAAGEDAAQRERGLALLREVQQRWPDSEEADRAEGKLFFHENLVVGKKIPDFDAEDIAGQAFKLSDYAGKVTVVDFWGFW